MTQLNLRRPFVQLVGRADLNVGGGEGGGLVIAGTLPALTGALRLKKSLPMVIGGSLPALTGAVVLEVERSVYRGVQAGAAAHWQAGDALQAGASAHWQAGDALQAGASALWQAGQGEAAGVAARIATRTPAPSGQAARWQAGAPQSTSIGSDWQDRAPAPSHAAARWQRGQGVGDGARQGHQDRTPVPAVRRTGWQAGVARALALEGRSQTGQPLPVGIATRHQYGLGRTGWGGPIVIVVPPDPPDNDGCAAHPIGFVQLQLLKPATGDRTSLNLRCVGSIAPVIVPVQRVYMSVNQIEVVTLPARAAVDVLSLDISIDVDSWCWTCTGSIPASQMDLVDGAGGAPSEIEATINGVQWVFVVEQLARERSFGKARVRFTARSRAAYLADPFSAPVSRGNATATTARQLIDEALPFGWSLDWQAADWLVPAGAWAHHGTVMEAALAVAGAIRGQLHAHRSATELVLRPRYVHAPWDWDSSTPDVSLPINVVTREGVEWREAPPYNRAYVSGTGAGIVGEVTREGTAGDVLAPLATDPLITAVEAARQRGVVELAQGGRSALVSLEVPLIPSLGLGLLECGRLLEVADGSDTWRGVVRSVRVSPAAKRVRQAITVERHYT